MSKNTIVRDFYTQSQSYDLLDTNGDSFGVSYVTYEIYKQVDVSNLQVQNGFIVNIKQRLVIPNQNLKIGAVVRNGYDHYLGLIANRTTLTPPAGATLKILSYFPRTLNASQNTDSSSNGMLNNQNASGSVNSNVNTYGITLDGGFYNDIPAAKINFGYSRSWVGDHLQESALGKNSHLIDSSNNGLSMSMKDWQAIGQADPANAGIICVWAQEWPWNTLLYNAIGPDGHIALPKQIAQRLYDGQTLLPPSTLSLTGVDFTSRATWLLQYPVGTTPDFSEMLGVTHSTSLYSASHGLSSGVLTADLDNSLTAQVATFSTPFIDLNLYALAPLDTMAYIDFVTDDFIIPPGQPNNSSFKIASRNHDLLASGSGFDETMAVSFIEPQTQADIDLTFKIAQKNQSYELVLVHQTSCSMANGSLLLNIQTSINGVQSLPVQITHYGDAETVIGLRTLSDYSNIDSKDDLWLGVNQVSIQITCLDQTLSNIFALRSVALRASQ